MTNAAQVKFKTDNLTQVVKSPASGITFVLGQSEKGPFAKPDSIINTWPQFIEEYGGLMGTSIAPLLVKRMLEKGAPIRFSRVGHYTDVTDSSTLVATKAVASDDVVDGLNELFELVPKNPGAWGNGLNVFITVGSNGGAEYFNISITHDTDTTVNEVYKNLIIDGAPSAANSNYLSDIVNYSKYFDVVYKDLSASAIDAPFIPAPIAITFSTGTDATGVVATDYIGDSSSLTGFHAFDNYDDAMQIIVADSIEDTVHQAGAAYATLRKDIFYFLHLSNLITDKTSIIAKRDALLLDTKFAAIFGGGLTVLNPTNNQKISIEAITDICALASNSDTEFGEWYSFAGPNRGVIDNALGVINNFGSPARALDLNDLANRQVNMIINRNNGIKLWGNFTAQLKTDQESQLSIARLVVFLQKSLKPLLEGYLEEPNDIPTWKRIYYTVRPFLDTMVTKRALFSYLWQGDQDAASLNNLTINNATDVGQGKYKIKFSIKPIASIQEISVTITLVDGSVSFETL